MSHQGLSRNTSIWMGAQRKSSFWPHSLISLDGPALTQGFPHRGGCSQLQRAHQSKWPAARPVLGQTPSPWPCAEYFNTDSFLLLTRDQPLQSPQSTSKFHQPLCPDFTVHQPGPAWAKEYPETENPCLMCSLAGWPADNAFISLSLSFFSSKME